MQSYQEAVEQFLTCQWALCCDVEYDMRSERSTGLGKWSDPKKPAHFHLKYPDYETRDMVSRTKVIVRYPSGNASHFKRVTGHDSSYIVLNVDQLPAQIGQVITELTDKHYFRCRLWIDNQWWPRIINCRECPEVLNCVTKGWEVNVPS